MPGFRLEDVWLASLLPFALNTYFDTKERSKRRPSPSSHPYHRLIGAVGGAMPTLESLSAREARDQRGDGESRAPPSGCPSSNGDSRESSFSHLSLSEYSAGAQTGREIHGNRCATQRMATVSFSVVEGPSRTLASQGPKHTIDGMQHESCRYLLASCIRKVLIAVVVSSPDCSYY